MARRTTTPAGTTILVSIDHGYEQGNSIHYYTWRLATQPDPDNPVHGQVEGWVGSWWADQRDDDGHVVGPTLWHTSIGRVVDDVLWTAGVMTRLSTGGGKTR